MTVKDISQGGVSLHVSGTNNLQVGNVLTIYFDLEDKKKTHLKKEVSILSIQGNMLGCRFSDNQLYEKELGFYLQGG